MKQIKNYLSRIRGFNNILLLAATKEFEELALWVTESGKAKKVYTHLSEVTETLPIIDAVIFDYECNERDECLSVIKPKFVIGRMEEEEDYFPVWEMCRETADFIYIEQERTSGIPQILEWKKVGAVELSVIVPVYQVVEYLPRCLETLTAWKAPYVEYLLINDGSTDGSRDIILDYVNRDRRIRLIDKENGGCASARNLGLKEAGGKYIGFVDSDDFIEESMFQKLLKRALMGNYDMAYCGYQEYYQDIGKSEPVLNDCLFSPYLEGTYRPDRVQLLAVNTRVAIWRAIYKKELLDKRQIQFHEDLPRFDDLPFRIEFLFAAGSAVCVPEYLYYYRLGRKGQDVTCRDKGLFVHFTIFEHLDKYVDTYKDRKLVDLLQVVKINTHGFALSGIEKIYRKEYIRLARRQLDRNMGYLRTVGLIMRYSGKGHLGWYTRMKL